MQQPYTNTKPHAVHIGGKRIEPGETRLVDMAETSGKAADIPASDEFDEEAQRFAYVRDLAEDKVEAITNALPHLSAEELQELQRLEDDRDKPRVTVTKMITEQLLKLAQGDEGGDSESSGVKKQADTTVD